MRLGERIEKGGRSSSCIGTTEWDGGDKCWCYKLFFERKCVRGEEGVDRGKEGVVVVAVELQSGTEGTNVAATNFFQAKMRLLCV